MNTNRLLRMMALAFVATAFFQSAPDMVAQVLNTSGALNAPTTQSGLTTGMNEVLRWVFLFLKFLAVCACGWGSYNMWKGEISSGVWSYVAALALFFAPALVDLAQKIGQSASS